MSQTERMTKKAQWQEHFQTVHTRMWRSEHRGQGGDRREWGQTGSRPVPLGIADRGKKSGFYSEWKEIWTALRNDIIELMFWKYKCSCGWKRSEELGKQEGGETALLSKGNETCLRRGDRDVIWGRWGDGTGEKWPHLFEGTTDHQGLLLLTGI